MRLTAGEIAALLPLLRPGVEIEIVLHANEKGEATVTEDNAPRRKRSTTRWTPEARAAAGARMVAARRKKQEMASQQETPAEAVAEPMVAPPPTEEPMRTIKVEAFATGGTPDQRQVAILKAETERMRQQKAGGGQ